MIIFSLTLMLSLGKGPAADDERYKQLETFARVLAYIEQNYVDEIDRQKLMRGAVEGMLGTLDVHSAYLPPEVFREMEMDTSGIQGNIGIEIVRRGELLEIVGVAEESPAARAGLQIKDHIVSIDKHAVSGMSVPELLQKLRGPAGTKVVLGVRRVGFQQPQELVVLRDVNRLSAVESKLYGQIGYVRLKTFSDRCAQAVQRELNKLRAEAPEKKLKGVVLDLRNNPGGLVDQAVQLADIFLPGGLAIVETKSKNGRESTVERSKEAGTEPAYPLAVLVNAGTASASEIVAGALQDHHRAAIIGATTFGKGSVQQIVPLDDGSGLKLTIARYFTPTGRSIQELGILPDFPVETEDKQPRTRERDLPRHLVHAGAEAKPRPWDVEFKPTAWSKQLSDSGLKLGLEFVQSATNFEGGVKR